MSKFLFIGKKRDLKIHCFRIARKSKVLELCLEPEITGTVAV